MVQVWGHQGDFDSSLRGLLNKQPSWFWPRESRITLNESALVLYYPGSKQTLNGYLLVDCFWSGTEAGKFFPYGKKKKKKKMKKIKCEKNLQNEVFLDPTRCPSPRLHTVIISVGAHFITGHPGSSKLVNWRISWIPKISVLILQCSFPSCWAVQRHGFFSVVSYGVQWSPFSPFQMPRNACFLRLVTLPSSILLRCIV